MMHDIRMLRLFQEWSSIFIDQETELTQLDSVAGDGDLGIVMKDGFQAIQKYVTGCSETDLGKCFYQVGKVFNEVASSSMGTLLSMGFMTAGKKLRNVEGLDQSSLNLLMQGIIEGVQEMGQAKEGEKTFLDGMYPALRAGLAAEHKEATIYGDAVLTAAQNGVDNATKLQAIHGRMAYRREDSKGMIDPGSIVALHMVEGIANTIRQTGG